MSVLVAMTVKVKDWEAFRDASNWAHGKGRFPGQISSTVFRQEGDPNHVLYLEEWDDHDSFHKASDELGDEFNRRAKTEGLEWVTHVWQKAEDVKPL